MDIAEIKNEIDILENSETNWSNIQKLSWLYIVRDHILFTNDDMSQCTMPKYDGEFGQVVSGKHIDGIMNILSEHMSVIKVLHPKEYQAVLDRIADIK